MNYKISTEKFDKNEAARLLKIKWWNGPKKIINHNIAAIVVADMHKLKNISEGMIYCLKKHKYNAMKL